MPKCYFLLYEEYMTEKESPPIVKWNSI